MPNDPNSLANQIYGSNQYAVDQIQGYDPSRPNTGAGWAGFAFSPSAGWQQNADGSLSLASALTQNTTPDNPISNPNPNTDSIAKPIPQNYNPKTGLFDSGTGNVNTGANVTPGSLGGGTRQPLQLDDDLKKILMQLLQESQNQSASGQNLLKGLLDQLQGNINFNQAQTTRTGGQRDALVSALLGGNFDDTGAFTANGQGLLGGYNQLLGKIDQGLDPMTMAALQQQAIEGPQRDYQGQVEQLKTALAGRGAYGGGDTPGSLGDIVRGYAPLQTARDTTREGLLQQTAFQNQAQKNDNNQLVAQALSQLGGLTTNLASNYNPANFNNATTNALQNALSGVGQNTQTGFQGLNTAGNLAAILNDTSTGSLGSLLKGALAGTGLNALTTKTTGGKSILGSLIGLIPGLGGGQGPQRDPNADWEAINNWMAQQGLPQLDPGLKDILMQNPGVYAGGPL